jgi:hypothetical protein
MTSPFVYPPAHRRRHGPVGYLHHASYRPWLRDEFSFRCVYCLLREQWGVVRGSFHVDHFQPIANRPDLAATYDNLIYACTSCNLAKANEETSDPLSALTRDKVRVSEDGQLHTEDADAAALIEILGLNTEEFVAFRQAWIGIIALTAKNNPSLHRQLIGFPVDLPDLRRLRPPGGNTRPDGTRFSFHAQRKHGRLPEMY